MIFRDSSNVDVDLAMNGGKLQTIFVEDQIDINGIYTGFLDVRGPGSVNLNNGGNAISGLNLGSGSMNLTTASEFSQLSVGEGTSLTADLTYANGAAPAGSHQFDIDGDADITMAGGFSGELNSSSTTRIQAESIGNSTINIVGGETTIAHQPGQDMEFHNDNVLNITGSGALNVEADISLQSASSSLTINNSGDEQQVTISRNIDNSGTVTLNGGAIGGVVDNRGGATMTIASGSNAGSVSNEIGATFSLDNSENSVGGIINNAVGGSVEVSSSTNAGTLNNAEGGSLTFDNAINSGTINTGSTINDGNLTNSAEGGINVTGTFTQSAGALVNEGDLTAGSVIVDNAELSGSGTIHGDLQVLGGTVNPGSSPGTLSIDGDAFFDSSSIFNLEIAGQENFDQLFVTGDLTIEDGATIQVDFTDGYLPLLDESFNFFSAGSLGLDINKLIFNVADLGDGYEWAFSDQENTLAMQITAQGVAEVPVPAAAWLFGSALIGLVGIKRRQSNVQVRPSLLSEIDKIGG